MFDSWYRRRGKRWLDVGLAAAALILLAPALVVLGLLVRFDLGSPILFRQRRPGRGGATFVLLKLRSMRDTRDAAGNLLPDEQRLTRLGRLLRATSLDELPQLWNVLKGEMSLVGPRPLLIEYLPRYTPQQARRHDVRPGVTGWAQVNGRQDIPFSRRLELDVWYVDHLSFALDCRILRLSAAKAFAGRGVRSGQDVRAVDDLGLHDDARAPAAGGPADAVVPMQPAGADSAEQKETSHDHDDRLGRVA